jgi:peptidoglycan hydrolase CwlO-like protein
MNLVDISRIATAVVVILNFVGLIVLFIANKLSFTKIMTNDLKHIDVKLEEIKKEQQDSRKEIAILGSSVSYLKGQYDSIFTLVSKTRGK